MIQEMKMKIIFTLSILMLGTTILYSQNTSLKDNNIEAINVFMSSQQLDGEDIVRVIKDSAIVEFDEPTFVRIKDVNFINGTIEVKVLSRLLADAPDFSRGFIGLVFRVNEDNSKFESIYIRPTNGRVENQLRRNHSVQYFAYPDYKFQRLRKESPEMYESYADMTLDEWITLRIEVDGEKARLYINDNEQPSLIVNDLKLGANTQGAIGLFVDIGTDGLFKDLKVY